VARGKRYWSLRIGVVRPSPTQSWSIVEGVCGLELMIASNENDAIELAVKQYELAERERFRISVQREA
jgi:hypothetical protein